MFTLTQCLEMLEKQIIMAWSRDKRYLCSLVYLVVLGREQRLEMLEKQFVELESHYLKVLEKVAAA